ncbi:MAG TPA: protein kinase [Gemmatimonadales bacterium]|nr:protein kinase [Gemmatimonadales bacterium]
MAELSDRLHAALGNNYRILRELGGGGMSRVFLAEETRLGRRVVIKVLPPDMAAGVNADRFEREIQLAASLQHPHIVQLLTAGAHDDLAYYVMPFIEGESLRARLGREGALPMGEVLHILHNVVDALAYSHAHGVVHRDIKPDNVMLSGKHALVTDFGVAKAVSASSGDGHTNLTSLGIALGTPAYMAPEQAAADPRVDHRADIYAVGAMAYEMLCGRTPFVAPTPQGMLAAHISERPEAPSRYRNTIPPAMNELVLRCLEKNPADRIQSADEIAARLTAMATPTGGTTPISTAPVSTARHEAADALRRAAPARVLGLFALASVAVIASAFAMTRIFDLPDWIWQGAAAAMALGLPIIAYTGRVERKRAVALTMGTLRFEPEPAHHGWFTWKRTIWGGALALGLVALLSAGFVISKKLGVGPGSTLMSAGVLAAQDRIILVEFENRTSDSTLGASVTEALRIDLGQSNVMRVVEPSDLQAALQRMGRPGDTRVTQAVATDVARREGIKGIITGEITSLGSGYSLAARVINANTGETLIPIRETANDASQLIGAVDKLSKALREKIGESLGNIRAGDRLEQVTTSSFEALRLYTEATDKHSHGDSEGAVPLLRQAVAVDSTFAMAWRKLAVVLPQALPGSGAESLDAAKRAYQYRDRLPPVERGLTEAYYHEIVTEDQAKVEAAYRSVLAANPDEPTALNNLGLKLNSEGRAAEAEVLLRHLVATSQIQSGLINLVHSLQLQGKDAAADSALAELRRRNPASARPDDMLRARAYMRRDFRTADSLLRDPGRVQGSAPADRVNEQWERLGLATAVGKLGDAGRLAADLANTMAAVGDRGTALYLRSLPAIQKGYFLGEWKTWADQADTIFAPAVLNSLPEEQRAYMGLASGYAFAGRPADVRRLRTEWTRVRPAEQRTASDSVYWVAMLAQAEGRWRDAAMAFDAHRALARCPNCELWEAGWAWDRAGEPDSALARFESSVTLPDSRTNYVNATNEVAPTYRRLGEMYETRGDRTKALKYYGDFVDLWREADAVLQPQVAEVKARMAGLAGEK